MGSFIHPAPTGHTILQVLSVPKFRIIFGQSIIDEPPVRHRAICVVFLPPILILRYFKAGQLKTTAQSISLWENTRPKRWRLARSYDRIDMLRSTCLIFKFDLTCFFFSFKILLFCLSMFNVLICFYNNIANNTVQRGAKTKHQIEQAQRFPVTVLFRWQSSI